MCVGTELQGVVPRQKGKALLGAKWRVEGKDRPLRRIQMINPATIPKRRINPDIIPTTVSTIDEFKSPNNHKNTSAVIPQTPEPQ
jgi:hypothetical protein